MKRYFHELTDEEHKALEDSGATWADCVEQFNQPTWCRYHHALNGEMGCCSLVSRRVRTEDDCNGCDLYTGQIELQIKEAQVKIGRLNSQIDQQKRILKGVGQ